MKLFTRYKLKDMELKNRIVMPPMCMYRAKDGNTNDWHFTHYTSRAVGGVGLILFEATGVESRGRISDGDLGLWRDEQIEGLAKIVRVCKEHGAKVGIQLAHAGRKSEVTTEASVAPSPIAFSDKYRVPYELTKEEIRKIISAFRDAAGRAERAGFDVIEIHAAHGYLINEFLSPLTNHRTDEYGGSEENRSRLLKEILEQVKKVWPEDKPIIVRVSAEEYQEGGNNTQIVARIINDLKLIGIDIVNVSSGGVVNVNMNVFPGYQVKFAESIRKETDIPVIAGGLITSPLMAEEILQNERADLIFLGRELLRNPYWSLEAAKILGATIDWPVPYERAR
ncbi:MAG TPA: NADPH dehydrogenase NamA [Mobilitalea sp.]|nr:NADPH dehydrogenase NamA [Mobilitalea sp.]